MQSYARNRILVNARMGYGQPGHREGREGTLGSSDQDGASGGPADIGPRVVTMRDIATAAGVSQSTVSRVLSGAPSSVSIGTDTRERILEVADRLNYRPNPLARGLRGASTMLLGVIVRDIMDPFFAAAVEAVTTHARRRGYNVVLGQAHGRADEAILLRSVLETRHCDAILVLGDMGDQPRLVEDLVASPIPTVALWHGSPQRGIETVNVDNKAGVEQALDLFVSMGHSRIALISGRPLGDIQARRAAFLEFMSAHGLAVPDAYLVSTRNDAGSGSAAMRVLLKGEEPPTAVLATTDVLAIGALHGAHEAGLGVPEGVSVAGFDDIAIAAYSVPALTTVRMPVAEMASLAVGLAVDRAEGRQPASKGPYLLAPKLVVRRSVGPPISTARR
jgi:DNA-binding LacI/PurR family transcriptional regulator